MSRNLEEEFDALKNEVKALSEAIKHLSNDDKSAKASDPSEMREELQKKCPRAYALREQTLDHQSYVSYFGFFETSDLVGGQSYFWDLQRSGEELLSINDELVAKVLTALGSKQRVAILKSILAKPSSAQDLVDKLHLGTTGQVYHHLKALQSADLIKQEERGLFAFKGHRATGLIMLLVGVAEMIDQKYSSGKWEEKVEG